MDVSKVAVQQVLRPTETCLFIVVGKVLDVQSHDDRVLAVVRHEGTQEHALFVFEVDTMGQLIIDQILSIQGSFKEHLQSSAPGGCRVQIMTNEGSALVFKLPYSSATAKLFSLLKTGRDAFASSSTVHSPSAFAWLKGYESCRTGWDRFSKPGHTSPPPLIDFGHLESHPSSENGETYEPGFPDKWPWSYIITPRPDGSTDMAVCESLVDEFDPLLQQPVATVGTTSALTNSNITFHIGGRLSPKNSLRIPRHHRLPSNDPFMPATNPFVSSLKAHGNSARCRSETNIAVLEKESSPRQARGLLHTSHSEEDILSETPRRKGHGAESDLATRKAAAMSAIPSVVVRDSIIAGDVMETSSPLKPIPLPRSSSPVSRLNPLKKSPQSARKKSLPRERPQGAVFTSSSDSYQMDNPFHDQEDSDTASPHRSWLEDGESSIELRDVDTDEEEKFILKKNQNNANNDVKRLEEKVVDHSRQRSSTTVPNSSSAAGAEAKFSHRAGSSSSLHLGKPRSPIPFRKKHLSHSPDPSSQSAWVTRYQPGVLLLQGSVRECLIQRMLREKESDFCLIKDLRLFCGTWNVNGQHPMQRMDKFILSDSEAADIVAIGFQELDMSTEAFVRNESAREELWLDLVESSLSMTEKKYKRVASVRLVGTMLVVYAEESLMTYITETETDYVATGILGILGNKGGVAVRFNLHHTSICIVNCHLAAGLDEVEKRNQDYHQIYNKISFFKSTSQPYSIMDHHAIVWMGDLNYRIPVTPDLSVEMIKAMADSYQTQQLMRTDQLKQQQHEGAVLTQFSELDIQFKPTYKYDPSTNSWDTSEKNRAPAWCDRILYHCEDSTLTCQRYNSHPEMIISDHKPVSALFDLRIKQVIPEKEKEVLEQITWNLDKQENETLPQVSLNSLEFKFNNVKFMVPQVQHLQVRNVGQRAVQVCFLPTPDKKDSICLDWLSIKPSSAVILPHDKVTMELTLLVDMEVAPILNVGSEKLEDILVLHLKGGKDFFISLTGNYLPSCFGSSLEMLVKMHDYARGIPTDELLDISLSSSWEEYDSRGVPKKHQKAPDLDIPKELFQLVDYLKKHYAMKEETLFTDGGLTGEQEKIREVLDTGRQQLSGSVFSVAATLLTFLRSLIHPVVPHNLHQKCTDACNNPTLCKQVLMLMPKVHRRTFVFIITFLKESLKHPLNRMDAKVLASVFGDVLLAIPPMMRKTASRKSAVQSNKKRAAFIYQFLVNDLTARYR